jgi:hypothetical protein
MPWASASQRLYAEIRRFSAELLKPRWREEAGSAAIVAYRGAPRQDAGDRGSTVGATDDTP